MFKLKRGTRNRVLSLFAFTMSATHGKTTAINITQQPIISSKESCVSGRIIAEAITANTDSVDIIRVANDASRYFCPTI